MTAVPALPQKLAAEFLGTCLLLMTVVGSGIMSERLAGGNAAIALLGNTLPTGAMLVVLITMFAPISGAHLNPVVTGVFYLKQEISLRTGVIYAAAQLSGAYVGVLTAHAMFALPLFQISMKVRAGFSQGLSEAVATFGLLLTILLTRQIRPDAVAISVGLYIGAAYWFTASTSFANPAVAVVRAFSDTFAGIDPANVPLFVLAEVVGALAALAAASRLTPPDEHSPNASTFS